MMLTRHRSVAAGGLIGGLATAFVLVAALLPAAAEDAAEVKAVVPAAQAAEPEPTEVILPPVPQPADPSVAEVNELRALAGLEPVAHDAALAAGAAEHARYMVATGLLTHVQDPASPFHSADGEAAGRNANLFVSEESDASERDAIHSLMTAPFHGIAFLDPALERVGAAVHRDGEAAHWRTGYAIDVLRGRASTEDPQPGEPIVWPGDGATVPLASYAGHERPDPLSSCPGFEAPSGLPLYVQFGSYEPVLDAELRADDGSVVPVCSFDQETYRNPDPAAQQVAREALALRDAAVLLPQVPLREGTTYHVEVRTPERTLGWSFTVE